MAPADTGASYTHTHPQPVSDRPGLLFIFFAWHAFIAHQGVFKISANMTRNKNKTACPAPGTLVAQTSFISRLMGKQTKRTSQGGQE